MLELKHFALLARCRRAPNLLISGKIAILCTAAAAVTLGAGADGHGHGSAGGSRGRGGAGLEAHLMRSSGAPHMGIIFPTPMQLRASLFGGEPLPGSGPIGMPAGGAIVEHEREHQAMDHLAGPLIYRHGHAAGPGEALISPANAPGADESDQGGGATAQPTPTASPSSARPPGAIGPGLPVFGLSGPGLPGPGRPERPRW